MRNKVERKLTSYSRGKFERKNRKFTLKIVIWKVTKNSLGSIIKNPNIGGAFLLYKIIIIYFLSLEILKLNPGPLLVREALHRQTYYA